MIEEHGEEEEEGAEELGESGDPGDGFGVDGMEGEEEGCPEGQGGRGERGDEEVDQGDNGGIEDHVDEMPGERIPAEDLVFGGVDDDLEGAVVIAAVGGVFLTFVGEGPDVAGESLAEIFCFEDQGVLEDLEFVVGDEIVAEGGGVEGERKKDEDGKMEEAGTGTGRSSRPIRR